MKIGQKGAWPRSRDLLFKFRHPTISAEWLKIQTSNFTCGLKVRDNEPTNEIWVKKGRSLGHVTYFSNIGFALIFPEWLKIQTSNLASRLIVSDTKRKKIKTRCSAIAERPRCRVH